MNCDLDIVQIYPRLPPAIDGIGDYALTLARGLKQHGIQTCFMTGFQHNQPPETHPFPAIMLPTDSPRAFVDAVPEDVQTIVLQYSDYPYDPKRGAPFWLIHALKHLKQQRSIRLLVIFHEFPSFYLLKKTAYLFPWQRAVAWRLAALADVLITNNAATQRLLTDWLPQPTLNLPVFSNVGELAQPLPLVQRDRRLIVFGTPGRRARVYQRSHTMLHHICQLLSIEKIDDIGPPLPLKTTEIAGIPVMEWGEQSAARVSELMSTAIAGLVYSTDNQRLAKSGVFATYCAHGLVPIVSDGQSALLDGLVADAHFLTGTGSQMPNLAVLQAIADNAYRWYSQHNQAKTIQTIAAQIRALN